MLSCNEMTQIKENHEGKVMEIWHLCLFKTHLDWMQHMHSPPFRAGYYVSVSYMMSLFVFIH